MNNPDQETVLRAIEDARRILGEYIEAGQSDAARTMERLIAVLDKNDVVHALDRMYRRRVPRLVTDRHCPKGSIQSSSIGPPTARLGSKAGQTVRGQVRRHREKPVRYQQPHIEPRVGTS
jgi:hypothetical protein